VRKWLQSAHGHRSELIEPFAGGAIVGLTAVFEGLVQRATLVELDEDIAAVWETILNGQGMELAQRIREFVMTAENVKIIMERPVESVVDRAFLTILRNRVSRGGIIAPGAGIVKRGENGKGLASRWYPETLYKRISEIVTRKDRFLFVRADGMGVMRYNSERQDVAYFIDPPYTVAGRRLYRHNEIDHAALFAVASRLKGDVLITYDDSTQIRSLAKKHGFTLREVPMQTTHHSTKTELLIGRNLWWLGAG
jgi:DNA adenine methylase